MKCSTSFKISPSEDGGLQPDTNFELFIYILYTEESELQNSKLFFVSV